MQTLMERGCGLDVHQATVVACILIVRKDGKVQKQVRTFGTTTRAVELAGMDALARPYACGDGKHRHLLETSFCHPRRRRVGDCGGQRAAREEGP
jgi:hypothetical protein